MDKFNTASAMHEDTREEMLKKRQSDQRGFQRTGSFQQKSIQLYSGKEIDETGGILQKLGSDL